MQDCTFKPQLTEYHGEGVRRELSPGALKEVERMRTAREQAELVKKMLARGYSYPNNMPSQSDRSIALDEPGLSGIMGEGEPYEEEREDSGEGFGSGEEEKNEPLVTVDINLPEGVDQIVIFPGDSVDALAEEFALKHNLNTSMTEKLVTMLNSELEEGLQASEQD